jgi:ankyrin repeat protein
MPTDSFESPLTLAACGGHVDLAMLLIERGANIEEVNDEGYTPLMEAAREGHEEMVALLLSQGIYVYPFTLRSMFHGIFALYLLDVDVKVSVKTSYIY